MRTHLRWTELLQMLQDEYFFTCPYCWEHISMLLDLSVPEQAFVEDCEVCCNPIQVVYTVEANAIASFSAEPLGQ